MATTEEFCHDKYSSVVYQWLDSPAVSLLLKNWLTLEKLAMPSCAIPPFFALPEDVC